MGKAGWMCDLFVSYSKCRPRFLSPWHSWSVCNDVDGCYFCVALRAGLTHYQNDECTEALPALSFVCVIYAAHDHAFCQHVSFSTEFQKRNCIAFKIDNIESSSRMNKVKHWYFLFLLFAYYKHYYYLQYIWNRKWIKKLFYFVYLLYSF